MAEARADPALSMSKGSTRRRVGGWRGHALLSHRQNLRKRSIGLKSCLHGGVMPKATVEKVKDPQFNEVLGRDAFRYRTLRRIYDVCEGDTIHEISASQLGDADLHPSRSLQEALTYFRGEKLIRSRDFQWIHRLALEHKGLVE